MWPWMLECMPSVDLARFSLCSVFVCVCVCLSLSVCLSLCVSLCLSLSLNPRALSLSTPPPPPSPLSFSLFYCVWLCFVYYTTTCCWLRKSKIFTKSSCALTSLYWFRPCMDGLRTVFINFGVTRNRQTCFVCLCDNWLKMVAYGMFVTVILKQNFVYSLLFLN